MLNLQKYKDYKILIENADTLQFEEIDNVTNEITRLFKIYEVDEINKVVYLEPKQSSDNILIASNDSLQLPLAVVKNYNEAAKIMRVEATHIYRASRRAGRPDVLEYNNFLLIKI